MQYLTVNILAPNIVMLGLILKLILQGFRITLEVGPENVPVKSYGAFKKVSEKQAVHIF